MPPSQNASNAYDDNWELGGIEGVVWRPGNCKLGAAQLFSVSHPTAPPEHSFVAQPPSAQTHTSDKQRQPPPPPPSFNFIYKIFSIEKLTRVHTSNPPASAQYSKSNKNVTITSTVRLRW